MQLRSAKKYQGEGLHRVVSPDETFRRVRKLLPLLGITRLADITGLDRIGITTYSSIVPDTVDVLSVYNGKGPTKLHARVGAIMEAIERYSALRLDGDIVMGSYAQLSQQRPTLNPLTLMIKPHDGYTEAMDTGWVEGYDLLTEKAILIPAQAVSIAYEPRLGSPCYAYGTTNGLASGNVLEEAVCHALFELIERDAWTLAELGARYLPHAARKSLEAGESASIIDGDDDVERHPDIDLSRSGPTIQRLVGRFHRAGVQLRVKDSTSDLGIPCVLATALEDAGPEMVMAHFGLGTHLDASIAVIRAITEVAQSRAVDIQGVREDLVTDDTQVNPHARHTRRTSNVRKGSWYYRESQQKRPFDALPSRRNGDILEDIQFMLNRLREAGVKHVIVTDLTKPESGIPVVRVLIPGLESWAADHGRLGWRANRFWHGNREKTGFSGGAVHV